MSRPLSDDQLDEIADALINEAERQRDAEDQTKGGGDDAAA